MSFLKNLDAVLGIKEEEVKQEEIIQVSDLTPGIYMLQVDTQFGRAVQKMVIQR